MRHGHGALMSPHGVILFAMRSSDLRLITRGLVLILLFAQAALVSCSRQPVEQHPTLDPAGGEQGGTQETPVLEVAGFFDNEEMTLFLRHPTTNPSWYHQVLVFEGGEWVRRGSGADGPDRDGFYEDRISILWDDGLVENFATLGGYVAVHEGMRATRSAAAAEDVRRHPHLGGELGESDVRKFIAESREERPDTPLWAAVRSQVELDELRAQGHFLDLWQWRAHRGNPVGFADTGYVLDYRHSSEGRSAYSTNFDSDAGLPLMMFDPEQTGKRALRLEKLLAREYGQEANVRVLLGIEAEVFPDEAEMARMDETLARYSFDFVLGALHHQLPIYRERIRQRGLSSDAAIIADYFESLAYAATTGRYDSFAHPDLIRIYGTVKPFEPVQYESVIREFLSAAVENGTCIEVNTSGFTKGVFEIHPHPQILDWAQQVGVQLTLGSDAHRPDSVGQHFSQAYAAIRAAGFELLCYFEAGRKTEVSILS